MRDLDAYARKIGAQLRYEEYLYREEEREILMDMMKLKFRDEKRDLMALKRKREEMKQELTKSLGRGKKLDRLFSKLRIEMITLISQLRSKYRAKEEHLEGINWEKRN